MTMKSIIIYFSYTGHTRAVANILAEYLREKGETELRELKWLNKTGNFFSQGRQASLRGRAKVEDMNWDFSGYDLICLGTPVWAFITTPAMNTCLDKCTGISGKEMVLFTTSGGMGDERCQKYMRDILSRKGAVVFRRFAVPMNNVKDKEFVLSKIRAMYTS